MVALIALPIACKDIDGSEKLSPLHPTNQDANAGTWRPILLTNYATQLPVPTPAAITSTAYLAELDVIKKAQGNLSDSQRKSIA